MSDTIHTPRAQVNEGIQATSVSAEVMAVGQNATAVQNADRASSQHDLLQAVEQLRKELESLNLQPHAKAAVDEDIAKLQSATESKDNQSDHVGHILASLSGKLKMVGIVLSAAVNLSEPVRKIVEILRIPWNILNP
jgi:hypothetical protein